MAAIRRLNVDKLCIGRGQERNVAMMLKGVCLLFTILSLQEFARAFPLVPPDELASVCSGRQRSASSGVFSPRTTFSGEFTVSENPNESNSFFFWGSDRTADEITQHVTNALTSVEPDLTPCVEVISSEPPLVVMHNFVSSNDCDAVLEATRQQELKRSTMGATQDLYEGRTSSTAWLSDSVCPVPLRRLAEKTSRISQLPPSYMENLQVVRYLAGQEFTLHTDHLDSFNDLECRGRLATCLIYLDSPAKGGETSFPEFEFDLPPTKGSAVFFFNTRERPGMQGYDPNMFLNVDPRLRHSGLPVVQGEKWICNRWIHPIDYESGVRGME